MKKKEMCERCKDGRHKMCISRDITVREDNCNCGCVGNPYVGIVCLTEGCQRHEK